MPDPITKPAMPVYSPFGQAVARPRFGATGFGQTPDKGDILGGGAPKPSGDGDEGPKIVTGEDKVEISKPGGGDTGEPSNPSSGTQTPQGSGKGNFKYNAGVILSDVVPMMLGFVSIGTGPVGWMMFPAMWLAGHFLGKFGRKLSKDVDGGQLTGLAARLFQMKALFKNPQMVKNGSALGALENVLKGVPGGTWFVGKFGRFITNRAFDRAMMFDAAAEHDSIFKAIGASGKVGGLLMLGNAIMKLGNSAPGPFKWFFKLLGFALPWLGMKKKPEETQAPGNNQTQPPQK